LELDGLFELLNFFRSSASSPSNAMLANTGEMIPPCGVPALVNHHVRPLMNPAFSHFRSIALSIGTWVISQS
jgi:hypothetical protein